MFNVSTIAHTTHIKPIVQFLPNASQHCIVNGCNSFWYSCLQLIHISRNRGHIDQSFDKYFDMLENWLINELSKKESGDFIFRQDGAPPNWSLRVRQFSNIKLTDKWIGRSGQNNHDLISWPPRTHTIQFLFVGICEKLVYVPLFLEMWMSWRHEYQKLLQPLTMQCWDAFGKNWTIGLMFVMWAMVLTLNIF